MFPEEIDENDKKRPTTISFKIKNQTHELVSTLTKCTPSYVRCIKPNETKKAYDWDSKRVEHQVRYLNLKENIKVRRAGFCYRNVFEKFLRRFAILTTETFPFWNGPPADGIKLIMRSVEMDSKEWQLGKTKVFVKSPESLFLLEEQRERKYHSFAVRIQRAWRTYKSRKYFLDMKKIGADLLYGRKERKRLTINRDFRGDYLNLRDNPVLKALISNTMSNILKLDNPNETTLFSDTVVKYDRQMKTSHREIILTDQNLFIIGAEKAKDGPNKGKFVKVVKRKIPYSKIQGITLSTLADDFFVLHIEGDYDSVMENFLKTELLSVLAENYKLWASRSLSIKFQDNIVYTVKKTTFQSGGNMELKFRLDTTIRHVAVKNAGKSAEIRVPSGLSKDTRQQLSVKKNAASGTQNLSNQTQKMKIGAAAAYSTPNMLQKSHEPQNIFMASSGQSAVNLGSSMNFGSKSNNSTSQFNSLNQLGSSGNTLAAVAAKKKAPPPPSKKVPKCRALYVFHFILIIVGL